LYICFFTENLKFIPEFVFLLSLIHIFANHQNSNFLAQFDRVIPKIVSVRVLMTRYPFPRIQAKP